MKHQYLNQNLINNITLKLHKDSIFYDSIALASAATFIPKFYGELTSDNVNSKQIDACPLMENF